MPGTKIEIEYQGRKARYRIQWVGKDGTKLASQVGVRCLEPGNFIWGVELPEGTSDTFDESRAENAGLAAGSRSGNGTAITTKERRGFPRHICRIQALVTIEGTDRNAPAIVSDISLSGCYLEMLSPFPVNTLIELTMNPSNATLHVHGQVRTSQNGMGISFTGLTPENFEKLRKPAPPEGSAPKPVRATSPPPAQDNESEFELQHERSRPATTAAAKSGVAGQPSTADALEAVLRALFRKGILGRSEVAEELRRLWTAKS
jgi:PilZ domain-containing protein